MHLAADALSFSFLTFSHIKLSSPFGFFVGKKNKNKIEAAKKQIVESTKEEPSWFGFILEIILVLSLFSAKRIKPHGIHRYNYV